MLLRQNIDEDKENLRPDALCIENDHDVTPKKIQTQRNPFSVLKSQNHTANILKESNGGNARRNLQKQLSPEIELGDKLNNSTHSNDSIISVKLRKKESKGDGSSTDFEAEIAPINVRQTRRGRKTQTVPATSGLI